MALPSWSRTLVTSGIGYQSFLVSLLRFLKSTQSHRVPSFFLKTGLGHLLGTGTSDEPFAKHVIEELLKEAELGAREWIDVTVWRCLIILEVNFMVKLAMRRNVF